MHILQDSFNINLMIILHKKENHQQQKSRWVNRHNQNKPPFAVTAA